MNHLKVSKQNLIFKPGYHAFVIEGLITVGLASACWFGQPPIFRELLSGLVILVGFVMIGLFNNTYELNENEIIQKQLFGIRIRKFRLLESEKIEIFNYKFGALIRITYPEKKIDVMELVLPVHKARGFLEFLIENGYHIIDVNDLMESKFGLVFPNRQAIRRI